MDAEVTQETCEGKMYLTLKAKIFPNAEQEAAIAANIEGNRYVYNLMVTYSDSIFRRTGSSRASMISSGSRPLSGRGCPASTGCTTTPCTTPPTGS